MYDIGVAVWILLVALVGLNGFAAGVAAVLHLWRGAVRQRVRIIQAATATGLLPVAMVALPMFVQLGGSGGVPELVGTVIGMVLLLGLGALVSLPGAIVITRKLAGGGDAYKSFE